MPVKFLTPKNSLKILKPDLYSNIEITLAEASVSAGFPSPADDFKEMRISLDKTLVKNQEATFYARVSGQSMVGAGLDDGDLLIIDRSLEPVHNKIAVCFIDGEFTVKRLKATPEGIYLQPENPNYKPIKVEEGSELFIWGIVTHVIKQV